MLRKDLRSRLADIADISADSVPHNIPEEHIRVAAYFIHENTYGDSDECWIDAIRQLRRSRARDGQ